MSDITGATLKISFVFASIDFKQIKVRGKSHKNLLFFSPLTDFVPAAYQQPQVLSHVFMNCNFLLLCILLLIWAGIIF